MWTIVRIDEADYGCEERLPDEPLKVRVTIKNEEGSKRVFEYPEDLIVSRGLDEGDKWPEKYS